MKEMKHALSCDILQLIDLNVTFFMTRIVIRLSIGMGLKWTVSLFEYATYFESVGMLISQYKKVIIF